MNDNFGSQHHGRDTLMSGDTALPGHTAESPAKSEHPPGQPRLMQSEPLLQHHWASPFTEFEKTLCESTIPRYSQQSHVNSYIKFRWSGSGGAGKTKSSHPDPAGSRWRPRQETSLSPSLSPAESSSPATASLEAPYPQSPARRDSTPPAVLGATIVTPISPSTDSNLSERLQLSPPPDLWTTTPLMLPPQFGLASRMERKNRSLWDFYIKNWCPGRSVLERSNPWLKDFAEMHASVGIQAAMQSLAGIYIYDYLPTTSLQRQVKERFSAAETRLKHLLKTQQNLAADEVGELITILIILSMQDVVLVEHRAKKPAIPRWLQGFRLCDQLLQRSTSNKQALPNELIPAPSSLFVSQAIMVGRALILAETLMPLPSPKHFDPERHAGRFSWLFLGSTNKDRLEIHGGCGFSRRLLHGFSQITYCASRLHQHPESVVVPVTARFLYEDLIAMRQWSEESMDWETAQIMPAVMDRIRKLPDDYVIQSSAVMTNVTAEAWRVAAIIYLQCRVLRIPRNHPELVSKLTDLAKCIRILPTSGSQFTAQAPLFPTFLLGMLARTPTQKHVAKQWFDAVVDTPVRSSVSSLYDSLKRIWSWIDEDLGQQELSSWEQGRPIGGRYAWWEELVARIDYTEDEILYMT